MRDRGRTRLAQRDVAARAGVSLRSIQDWEAGVTLPSAQLLQRLLAALLEVGGLTPGQETSDARELWAAAVREAPRMRTPFDEEWFAALLAAHASMTPVPAQDVLRSLRAWEPGTGMAERGQDWGEAPDTMVFVGRAEELALLSRHVLEERCRLVAVLGIGGIGKTSLAARLAQTVAPSFERVYWRSLHNAPPVGEWLAGAIGFLSGQQLVPPLSDSERIAALLQLLRTRRSLLVLDNWETLFEPGPHAGRFRAGMAGYGRLLQALGGAAHQSCLVITSREAPPELASLDGGVRVLELHGLGTLEAQALLADKQLNGDAQAWASLVGRYGGNGLALKVVGETIRQLYVGNIAPFVADAVATYGTVFGGIRRLLEVQAARLSPLERDVLRRLAVEREPVSLAELAKDLPPGVAWTTFVEAIETLRRRSLVERGERGATFTLQSLVLEYMTDRLVETAADEIERGQPVVLVEQPLIKAQAKDYVRQTQERLIGAPILQHLTARLGRRGAEERLLALRSNWRGRPAPEQGYGPGNVVNLLRLLRGHLRELDLSQLAIRQAYLAQVDAQHASLADAHLAETVLAEAFDFPGSVALSGDGALLTAGTSTGQVCLWRAADRTPLWAVQGHTGGVWGMALSADGRVLASGGTDGAVRLWETGTGRLQATLLGHTGTVYDVALSADGQLLASGGTDGTVRLWEAASAGVDRVGSGAERTLQSEHALAAPPSGWRPLATLEGHTAAVFGVSLSADGQVIASGSADGTVRLWQAGAGQPVATLQGHTGTVWSVALSADGQVLASGGGEGTVRLWETRTARLRATLQGHTGEVYAVVLSADGQVLASGGGEGTVRLWETRTAQPRATLQGHTGAVYGAGLSADGQELASIGTEGTVRLWETGTGRPRATLQGHTGAVYGVAISADSHLLASVGTEGTVRLWQAPFAEGDAVERWAGRRGHLEHSSAAPPTGGLPLATLEGHVGTVYGVAVSANGRVLASGGGDGTVRLWQAGNAQPLATVEGHAGGVRAVALSTDGRLLASGGTDGTLRLWDTGTGQPHSTLQGHIGAVYGVALSVDTHLLASGGTDGSVRLWEARTGRPQAILQGHTGSVYGVVLSTGGRLLASGGGDGTVRLWETANARVGSGDASVERIQQSEAAPNEGRPRAILQGHTGAVYGVALSADGGLLASGGFDGTVRLWETSTGTWLRTLRPERRYERLDIAGLTGITDAQRAALLALGAVEQGVPLGDPTAPMPLESAR